MSHERKIEIAEVFTDTSTGTVHRVHLLMPDQVRLTNESEGSEDSIGFFTCLLLGFLVCIPLFTSTSRPRSGYTLYDPQLLPPPYNDTSNACGHQGTTKYLCDPKKILDDASASSLDKHLETERKEQTVPCSSGKVEGFAISVLVAERLDPLFCSECRRGRPDENELSEQLGTELLGAWRVGDSCRNGVMIVLSVKDEIFDIIPDKGASALLTTERVKEIHNVVNPLLNRGEFYDALELAKKEIGLSPSLLETHNYGVLDVLIDNLLALGALVALVFLVISLVYCCCYLMGAASVAEEADYQTITGGGRLGSV